MARGESQKVGSSSAALGLWAALGVVALGTAYLLAQALSDAPPAPIPSPALSSIERLRSIYATLGDRDCSLSDLESLRSQLFERGHRFVSESPPLELPLREAATDLEGACGVALVVAEPTALVNSVRAGDGPSVTPCVSRMASVALCGADTVAAEGTGRATVYLFVTPGLTPANVAETGLTPEAAVGLTEAELILGRAGYRAGPEAVRVERGGGTRTWEPPQPAHGCVAWVIATSGFSLAHSSLDTDSFASDSRVGRQLIGAVSCAGRHGALSLEDGGVLYALPFEDQSGPRLPGPVDRLTTIPEVRVVATPHLPSPTAPAPTP